MNVLAVYGTLALFFFLRRSCATSLHSESSSAYDSGVYGYWNGSFMLLMAINCLV